MHYTIKAATDEKGWCSFMTLGEIVHAYREKHHMTMKAFGERAGVSKGYVSILEKGVNPATGQPVKLRVETFDQIAAALGLTSGELKAQLLQAPPAPMEAPYDPISDLFDDLGVRTVARDEIGDATPEEMKEKKVLLKKMIRYMFSKEE